MLEFAISFVGLIMFIYVLLNVWVWLNGILVGRQQAFQQTRLAAGQPGSAGTPVPYARPPIKLSGLPSSAGGDTPPGTVDLIIGDPPCTAAQPYYDQAMVLANEAIELSNQVIPLSAQINAKAQQIQSLAAYCSSLPKKKQGGCFAGLPPLQAQLTALENQMIALDAEIQDKVNQAEALVEKGKAACP